MVQVKCPRCVGFLHPVYFGDNIRRYRCMTCQNIYEEPQWYVNRAGTGDAEIIKVYQTLSSKERAL